MIGNRGQVFTLEGVLAALIVLAGLAFALQAVVVTPSSSGANAGTVDVSQINSMLTQTTENGTLKRALLDADDVGYDLSNPDRGYFVGRYPDNAFGTALNETLGPTVTVNVIVHYRDASSNGFDSQRMIYNGAPGDGAARASTTVTVFDDEAPGTFYADDAGGATKTYNVFEVEVIAWQK